MVSLPFYCGTQSGFKVPPWVEGEHESILQCFELDWLSEPNTIQLNEKHKGRTHSNIHGKENKAILFKLTSPSFRANHVDVSKWYVNTEIWLCDNSNNWFNLPDASKFVSFCEIAISDSNDHLHAVFDLKLKIDQEYFTSKGYNRTSRNEVQMRIKIIIRMNGLIDTALSPPTVFIWSNPFSIYSSHKMLKRKKSNLTVNNGNINHVNSSNILNHYNASLIYGNQQRHAYTPVQFIGGDDSSSDEDDDDEDYYNPNVTSPKRKREAEEEPQVSKKVENLPKRSVDELLNLLIQENKKMQHTIDLINTNLQIFQSSSQKV